MLKGTTTRAAIAHQEIRKKLWADVWVAMANSSTCMTDAVATSWANMAVKEFDKTFAEDKK